MSANPNPADATGASLLLVPPILIVATHMGGLLATPMQTDAETAAASDRDCMRPMRRQRHGGRHLSHLGGSLTWSSWRWLGTGGPTMR